MHMCHFKVCVLNSSKMPVWRFHIYLSFTHCVLQHNIHYQMPHNLILKHWHAVKWEVSNKWSNEITEVVMDFKHHHTDHRLIYSLVCLHRWTLVTNYNNSDFRTCRSINLQKTRRISVWLHHINAYDDGAANRGISHQSGPIQSLRKEEKKKNRIFF